MHDIFISYSSHDSDHALLLAEQLHQSGYSCWIDRSGIDGAASWSKEITRALEGCSLVCVLLSEHSIASKNVAKEIGVASELGKHLLPIELSPVTLRGEFLYHLTNLHRVAYTNFEAIKGSISRLGITQDQDVPSELQQRINQPKIAPPQLLRLAVLPFDDLSPTKDNEWLADGMMDELIGTLSSLKELHVNPRNDVIYYKKNKPKLGVIAADLKCRYIVEGSVQKSGEKIRIRASLSDAAEHKQLWSEKFEGSFDEIFDLQDKTCFAITEALKLKLTPDEEKKIEKRPTENAEAYELWLKGTELYSRTTSKDYLRALAMYEEAIKLDPNFVLAYASISNVALAIYIQYIPTAEWLDKAEQAMQKILDIEGETANYCLVASRIAIRRGNIDRALELAKKGIALDPKYSAIYDALGFAYLAQGKKKEAVDALQNLVKLQENRILAHFALLTALHELGDTQLLVESALKAIPIYERHLRLNPDDRNAQVNLAGILRWADKKTEALAMADHISSSDGVDGHALYNLACIYLNSDLPERGLQILQRAISQGYKNKETFLSDHDLDPLRGSKAFEDLMKSLET